MGLILSTAFVHFKKTHIIYSGISIGILDTAPHAFPTTIEEPVPEQSQFLLRWYLFKKFLS